MHFQTLSDIPGYAIAQAVIRRHLTAEAGFDSRTVHVGFVLDKVALGESSVLLCHYYSTNAPYRISFMPPTLYNLRK